MHATTDYSTLGIVLAAFIAAVPATIAALAAWRGGRHTRTSNGHSAGQLLEILVRDFAEHREEDAAFQEWIISRLEDDAYDGDEDDSGPQE